ncbi:hypothetical protein ASPCAL15031 [Aspergillus calidoustus]|uniref:Uncharacterized protein n=1 Tax=Aspergillus calidoustus TaxID=454130 RepID=A0A0U5GHK7_ASPCI|nr:hypothetical protein ASPCAL15031 [Aspergillus calidoustus]
MQSSLSVDLHHLRERHHIAAEARVRRHPPSDIYLGHSGRGTTKRHPYLSPLGMPIVPDRRDGPTDGRDHHHGWSRQCQGFSTSLFLAQIAGLDAGNIYFAIPRCWLIVVGLRARTTRCLNVLGALLHLAGLPERCRLVGSWRPSLCLMHLMVIMNHVLYRR